MDGLECVHQAVDSAKQPQVNTPINYVVLRLIDMVIPAAQLLGTGTLQAASTGHKRSVREDQETDEGDGGTETKDQVRWLHCAVHVGIVFPQILGDWIDP